MEILLNTINGEFYNIMNIKQLDKDDLLITYNRPIINKVSNKHYTVYYLDANYTDKDFMTIISKKVFNDCLNYKIYSIISPIIIIYKRLCYQLDCVFIPIDFNILNNIFNSIDTHNNTIKYVSLINSIKALPNNIPITFINEIINTVFYNTPYKKELIKIVNRAYFNELIKNELSFLFL
jgi:hypothetical protein